jgi:hypothetical protein|tara:strand:- start:356 stop:562 length:207 start_codon:yes stop_codon:yes gene_type:complete
MKTMDIGNLNKMLQPNTAFATMIAEVGQADLMAMEELIVAIEEQICLPRKISVMQLFSVWANMEPIYA